MNAVLPEDTAALQSLVCSLRDENERLKLLIAKLRRMHFGRSSGKGSTLADQLELALEEMEGVRAEQTLRHAPAQAKPRPVREALPAHLPRETVEHLPQAACCPQCGGQLKRLGQSVSEMLEYIPASFRVIRHVRPKLACARCDAIVQAPAPARPIPHGVAGAGLLAHVLTAKYCDHLPLYRQSGIYAREGVKLERATLADWVGQCHALLRPLLKAIETHVLSATKLHADDTRRRCSPPGKAKQKPGVCGLTCATTAPPATRRRPPCGSPARRTGAANTRRRT
jgi:transposase